MKKAVICLVPFYNEGERILYTLSKLLQIKDITEIICIDDGSTDRGHLLIKKSYPQVKIIRLGKNTGKSNAILQGLQNITAYYVMLFDADLSNIQIDEIKNALCKITLSPQIDMIILRRIVESRLLSFIRHDIVMSGQRVLKTQDLKEVLKTNPKGYALEVAINHYMMKNKKKVFWMPLSTRNPKKIHKFGLLQSLSLYAEALKGYFSYAGFGGYIKQIKTFCTEQAI